MVGSTGIAGDAFIELLAKPDTARLNLEDRLWPGQTTLTLIGYLQKMCMYIQCHLLNEDDNVEKLSSLTESDPRLSSLTVTH